MILVDGSLMIDTSTLKPVFHSSAIWYSQVAAANMWVDESAAMNRTVLSKNLNGVTHFEPVLELNVTALLSARARVPDINRVPVLYLAITKPNDCDNLPLPI